MTFWQQVRATRTQSQLNNKEFQELHIPYNRKSCGRAAFRAHWLGTSVLSRGKVLPTCPLHHPGASSIFRRRRGCHCPPLPIQIGQNSKKQLKTIFSFNSILGARTLSLEVHRKLSFPSQFQESGHKLIKTPNCRKRGHCLKLGVKLVSPETKHCVEGRVDSWTKWGLC